MRRPVHTVPDDRRDRLAGHTKRRETGRCAKLFHLGFECCRKFLDRIETENSQKIIEPWAKLGLVEAQEGRDIDRAGQPVAQIVVQRQRIGERM